MTCGVKFGKVYDISSIWGLCRAFSPNSLYDNICFENNLMGHNFENTGC